MLACAIACGGAPKKNADQPILPPEPGPAAKPEPPIASKPAPEPEKPPEPMKPVDVAVPLGETTVKLVNAGKGKKAKLAFAPKVEAKQHVEIAMDFHAKQDQEDKTNPWLQQHRGIPG